MKTPTLPYLRYSFATVSLALLLSGCDASSSTAQDNQQRGTAFTNVNVIDVASGAVSQPMTVLIEGERILQIGESLVVAEGTEEIDGTGKYLMPGLAEMHGHIPDPNRNSQQDVDETLFLYVANGITTVRGMLGWEGQLALRGRAASGEILSPTLYLAGPSFNGSSVSSVTQALEKVRRQHAEGWDLLKIHPGLSLAEYDAIADEAARLGIRFGGHVPVEVGLSRAIEKGQETFDHLDGYNIALGGNTGAIDDAELLAIVKKTKDAGAMVVPTMVLWEALYGVPATTELEAYEELIYVSPGTRSSWRSRISQTKNSANYNPALSAMVIENRMKILGALNEGGVTILMGTDSPQLYSVPGFSLHREVQRMVEAGMSPLEVIQSGTINVGDYFKKSDTFGQIKPDHRADLVLLGSNPLLDTEHLKDIVGVMVRGRWVSRAEIDGKLEQIADRHNGSTN